MDLNNETNEYKHIGASQDDEYKLQIRIEGNIEKEIREIDRYRKRRRVKRPKRILNSNTYLKTTTLNKYKIYPLLSHNLLVILTFIALINQNAVYLYELPRVDLSNSNENGNSTSITVSNIAQPPSQLFLTPISQQRALSISLVNGVKKSDIEDDDEGFIMKTIPPQTTQNESTSDNRDLITDPINKEASNDETTTSTDANLASTTSPQIDTTTLIDQSGSVPIDVNRQQFLTHDQLSLLNSSTKDENIYLNNNEKDDQEPSIKRVQSPRSGMSKVSHVTSFFSDLFYSWPRPDSNNNNNGANQQTPQANNQAGNQRTTQQQVSTCPGICRSILTASILCRHEINAPCPSLFQKCCEKDDVSFNGTPVETSAPLSTPDTEPPNSTSQPEGNSVQEQSSSDIRQTSQTSTSTTRLQQQQQQQFRTSTTTSNSAAPTTTIAPTPNTAATQATANEPSVDDTTRNVSPNRSGELPIVSTTDSSVAIAGDNPGSSSVYFLSSGNGSSEQSLGLRYGLEQQQQQQQPKQSAGDFNEQQQGSRLKSQYPASQSFDSPLSVKPQTSTRSPSLGNQVVSVETANGTILHYAGERVKRPIYTNLTDYQMFMQQNRHNNGNQNVVYHSNIDPVKKFVDNSTTRKQQHPTTTTTTTIPSTSNYDLNTHQNSSPPIQSQSQTQQPINNSRRENNSNDREQLCNGLCMPKVHNLLCQVPSNQLKCGSDNEFCCLQMTEEVTEIIKKSLANSGSDLQRNANSDFRDTNTDKVLNDQHSSSNLNNKIRTQQQQKVATTTMPATTTTPQPPEIPNTTLPPHNVVGDLPSVSSQQQDNYFGDDKSNKVAGQQNSSGGVGDLLVGLLESWLGGSSTSNQPVENQQQIPTDRLDSHASDQRVTYVDNNPYYEPQNDRRLGLDLSSRQQQPDLNSNSTIGQQGQRQQVEANSVLSGLDSGLMTSDGSNEQAMESFSSSNLNGDSKCRGFCVVPLFARICDSTYSSSDCGGFSRCCVSKSDDSVDHSGNQLGSQFSSSTNGNNNNENRHQQAQAPKLCRGQCLRVYHSSLCTKPSELQLDSPGCLPNFVCCAQPSVQDGTNHIEDMENIMSAPSSSGLDSSLNSVQSQATTASMLPNNEQLIKDNSLLTALMPPPPPNLSISPSATAAEQQLMQEKSYLNDQHLVANGRQRQSSPSQEVAYQMYNQQQQQQNMLNTMNVRPNNNAKASQTGGGIISQLYQMFSKSSGSTKQRQRPPQSAQPIQAQHLQPQMSNFIPQLFDPYQAQQIQASTVHRQNNLSPPQQQLILSNQNMLVNQAAQFPTTYQIDGNQLLELQEQQQQQQQQSRNRFALQQQQQIMQQPNMLVAASNPQAQQQQLSSQPQVQKQLSKNPYQQQQKQIAPINLHLFNNDNAQLMINEKFAAPTHTDQSPTILAFNSANGINQQQPPAPPPQQLVSQQTQSSQNYVKSPSIGNQAAVQKQQQPQQQQQQQQHQATNNGFTFPTSNFPTAGERQRYQQQHFSNAPDNAHNSVSLNQAASPQHVTGLKSSQSSAYLNQQQQQVLSGNVQKQISGKPEQQQNSQNRPTVGNQPVRTQTQQQEQRYSIVGNVRNGNGQQQEQQVNLEQKSNVLRQNSHNRQNEVRQSVAEGTGQVEIVSSGQSTANQPARSGSATFVKGGQQTALLSPLVGGGSQKAGDPNLRVSGSSNNVVSSTNNVAAPNTRQQQSNTKITDNAIAKSQQQLPFIGDIPSSANSLSSSSSNLNVMISNGPFIDLQRVDSSLDASRRPLSTSGSNLSPTVVDIAANNKAQVATSNIKLHQRQQQQQQQVVSTATNIDDLNAQADLPQAMAPCLSTCLPPFVSFNCVEPNNIDENFYCPNPGSLCCMKGDEGVSHKPTGISVQESVVTNKRDPQQQQQQQQQQYVGQKQLVVNVEDNNKLETLSLSDQGELGENLSTNKQKELEVKTSSQSVSLDITPADLNGLSDEEQSSSLMNSKKNGFQATSCGLPGPRSRQTSGQARGRVMGGFEAKPDYWCWQAALMNDENQYLCGGALIGNKWVLTAAHCVTKHLLAEKELFVRLGQHNLNSTQGAHNARTIRVNTSYVHHNHNGVTLDNDIALLRLDEPADLDSPSICLVCLPEKSHQLEAGKRCTVTGYGFENETGPPALKIRQTDLPIVTDQECQTKTSAVLGKPFNLPLSSFCAGGVEGEDACQADGGGPLSCLVDGYYELTGIVSWGYKCGKKDLPGLYSKVSTFVGWINQIVSVNN